MAAVRGIAIVIAAIVGGTLLGQWDPMMGVIVICGGGAVGLAVTWVDLS